MANGAEENSVKRPEPLQAIFRHHAAVAEVVFTSPVEGFEFEAETVSRSPEDVGRGRDDFLADAVARDEGGAIRFHGRASSRVPASRFSATARLGPEVPKTRKSPSTRNPTRKPKSGWWPGARPRPRRRPQGAASFSRRCHGP